MSDRATAVNGGILRWARERAGISLGEIAERMNKTPNVIVAWEEGEGYPTFRQLERLADTYYKRPVALFFLPNPPEEPDPASEFRTLPAPEIEKFEPDTRLALREARARQESLRELTGGKNLAERFILRDIEADRDGPVDELAQEVRSYLNIDLRTQSSWAGTRDAFKEWRAAIEGAGVFVFKRPFVQREISGFCIHDDTFPIIMVNNSTSRSRQIFTLFHELGHLLFHVSGVTQLDDSYIADLSDTDREIEILCNRFAAEILVPEASFPWIDFRARTTDELRVQVARVAGRYNVSREVILRRLVDRGLVSSATYQEWVEEWHRDFLEERRSVSGGNYYANQAVYLGDSYLTLGFTAYHAGEISLSDLAQHFGMRARNVPTLEDFVISRK